MYHIALFSLNHSDENTFLIAYLQLIMRDKIPVLALNLAAIKAKALETRVLRRNWINKLCEHLRFYFDKSGICDKIPRQAA